MIVQVTHDGGKNAALQITGVAPEKSSFDLSRLTASEREIKIDAIYYAVASKAEVSIGWGKEHSIPVGGRGKVDFAEVRGFQNPHGHDATHLHFDALGEGPFAIILDLSKH